VLLAVDNTVRGSSRVAPLWLGAATCLALVSGHLDVAGQVLLVSGIFGSWRLLGTYWGQWFQAHAWSAVAKLGAGWALGFLLAAPYVLPALEYSRTGARMTRRAAGLEERRPEGLSALQQVLVPDIHGVQGNGSFRLNAENETESSAAAYAGLLAALFAAPLAWASQSHRKENVFWVFLALFGLGWCLNAPGIVHLLRLPLLNMMSHNRLTFATAFAILALAATGLEVLRLGQAGWRPWFWVPAVLLALLCAWSLYSAVFVPSRIEAQLFQAVRRGTHVIGLHGFETVGRFRDWFEAYFMRTAGLSALGLAGWCLLRYGKARQPWLLPATAAVLLADLLWFGCGHTFQSDPALYYPRLPVLEAVAKSTPGRVIGYTCLPPLLATMCGLRDVRGYDSVDPGRFVELVTNAAAPRPVTLDYSLTSTMSPKMSFDSEGHLRLPPLLDMLGVRYVIGRGAPLPGTHPAFQGADYWVLVNSNALPGAFIPRRVETVIDPAARLEKLTSPSFDPREVAYVESQLNPPSACRGTAEILDEVPTRLAVAVRMETPGMVVLSDLWDKGWQARLNGQPVPILRANHAVRGVLVPAGTSKLEFRYEPSSFSWGLRLSELALLVMLVWGGVAFWKQKAERAASSHTPA
jgi:hypothetical protein